MDQMMLFAAKCPQKTGTLQLHQLECQLDLQKKLVILLSETALSFRTCLTLSCACHSVFSKNALLRIFTGMQVWHHREAALLNAKWFMLHCMEWCANHELSQCNAHVPECNSRCVFSSSQSWEIRVMIGNSSSLTRRARSQESSAVGSIVSRKKPTAYIIIYHHDHYPMDFNH